ncbi:hypothetical protein SI65_08224 [Aspergillus cristatus]|uniref:Uncharacterized protein n=1 Tax=Aspergillus cristatus TaxID=573508 RepID=A0A1E3B5H6_ASPCR|nr:hypothetical protein SI65_08224 [Aspergillus cristatus]
MLDILNLLMQSIHVLITIVISLALELSLQLIHFTLQQCDLSILGLALGFFFSKADLTIIKAVVISSVDQSELLVQPLRLFRDIVDKLLKSHHVSLFALFSINEDGGSSVPLVGIVYFILVGIIIAHLVSVGPRRGNGISRFLRLISRL